MPLADVARRLFFPNKSRAERLILDFPGLEGQDPKLLGQIAAQAHLGATRGAVFFGIFALIGVASECLGLMLLSTLTTWFVVPPELVVLVVGLPTLYALHRIRLSRARRIQTRLVAATFPDLYCACGYCLRGRAGVARCPECGNQCATDRRAAV